MIWRIAETLNVGWFPHRNCRHAVEIAVISHNVCNTQPVSAGKIDGVVNKEAVSVPQFMTLRDVGCGDLGDHKWKLEQFLNFRDVISQVADDRWICFQFV